VRGEPERFRHADLKHEMPVPGHFIEHHALEVLFRQRRAKAHYLGDPHLDEPGICGEHAASFLPRWSSQHAPAAGHRNHEQLRSRR
jgi:hypothetical protein